MVRGPTPRSFRSLSPVTRLPCCCSIMHRGVRGCLSASTAARSYSWSSSLPFGFSPWSWIVLSRYWSRWGCPRRSPTSSWRQGYLHPEIVFIFSSVHGNTGDLLGCFQHLKGAAPCRHPVPDSSGRLSPPSWLRAHLLRRRPEPPDLRDSRCCVRYAATLSEHRPLPARREEIVAHLLPRVLESALVGKIYQRTPSQPAAQINPRGRGKTLRGRSTHRLQRTGAGKSYINKIKSYDKWKINQTSHHYGHMITGVNAVPRSLMPHAARPMP